MALAADLSRPVRHSHGHWRMGLHARRGNPAACKPVRHDGDAYLDATGCCVPVVFVPAPNEWLEASRISVSTGRMDVPGLSIYPEFWTGSVRMYSTIFR